MVDDPNSFGFMDNDEGDEYESAGEFEKHFLNGCNAFIFIASQLRGDPTPSDQIVHTIIKEIIGNRDTKSIRFQDILERLYERVIDYCADGIDTATLMTDVEDEISFKEYKKELKTYRKKKIVPKKKAKKKITRKGKK